MGDKNCTLSIHFCQKIMPMGSILKIKKYLEKIWFKKELERIDNDLKSINKKIQDSLEKSNQLNNKNQSRSKKRRFTLWGDKRSS